MTVVGDQFKEWIERLKQAPDESKFREIWREYIDSVKIGSMADYWVTKLIDRWGGPGGIFLALKQGKTLFTDGDLRDWEIKRLGEYVWEEEK